MALERFQPVAVASPVGSPWAFRLRCLVDLQLATIAHFLQPAMQQLTGTVLDVGAGQAPWRDWLPPDAQYQGLDIAHAADFGMQPQTPDVAYYDGGSMPFTDSCFGGVLCIEVLEHAQDPAWLLLEIHRVLKTDGLLLLTVPWSARRHHIPHDFHRFTREGLAQLLTKTGFHPIEIDERGNDIAVIANKLTVLSLRLVFPAPRWHVLATWPLALVCAPLAAIFIAAAHTSIAFGWGAKEDPLGYFVQARKGSLVHSGKAGLL